MIGGELKKESNNRIELDKYILSSSIKYRKVEYRIYILFMRIFAENNLS